MHITYLTIKGSLVNLPGRAITWTQTDPGGETRGYRGPSRRLGGGRRFSPRFSYNKCKC